MKGGKQMAAGAVSFELEIAIEAAPERVWQALTTETKVWWTQDFHMLGPDSVVTLDTSAGGGLVEHLEGSGSLLWYTVHWCQPRDFVLYMVGHLDADFGGPATSHLRLKIEPRPSGCVLQVRDSRHGCVDESSAASSREGWMSLFSDGLKRFAELRYK